MGRSHLDPFLAHFDASGNVTAVHLHADAVDALLASVTPSGGVSWYLTDNQGSVRSVLNAAGNVVDRITYDAFGGVAAETNPSAGGRFKYTGREWDGEIGLQYNRARYYDPSTGRWISQDPIGFAGGDADLDVQEVVWTEGRLFDAGRRWAEEGVVDAFPTNGGVIEVGGFPVRAWHDRDRLCNRGGSEPGDGLVPDRRDGRPCRSGS